MGAVEAVGYLARSLMIGCGLCLWRCVQKKIDRKRFEKQHPTRDWMESGMGKYPSDKLKTLPKRMRRDGPTPVSHDERTV